MHRSRPVSLLAASLVFLFSAVGSAGAVTSMRTGFHDGGFSDRSRQTELLGEASGLGASVARVATGWAGIAATRPTSPMDPADPAYDWSATDASVRATVNAGLQPILSLTQAPAWAEGGGRPAGLRALPGSWRPDPASYGLFAVALARRYDGTYPDPLMPGRTLPRVRAYLPWNEPNLEAYLAPQWSRRNGRVVAEAPYHYRKLVREFDAGIHRSQPDALVAAGALAPFGDALPGGRRTPPARFLRDMLCLSPRFRRVACGSYGSPRFDVLSHHPYSVGGPFREALNPDDVSVPDLAAKLVKPLRAAERLGVLGPPRRRRIWVTEISWDSRPADPDGVPERRHADWLAQALYVLARQGVDTVTWFQVRDSPPGPGRNYGVTSQSGVLLRSGRPKFAATAFRFPLVAVRPAGRTTVWALAPTSGPLVVERRTKRGWTAVLRRSSVRRGTIVQRRFTGLRRGTVLRARAGGLRSLSVRVSSGR